MRFLRFCAFSFFPLFSQIALLGQWSQTNGPTGGWVYSLAERDGTIWAGTKGGLYKSTSNALSWESVAAFFANHIVTEIQIIDNEIWVAAKEGAGFVFYRSDDNGATWIATNLNNPVSADEVLQLWRVQNALFLKKDNFLFEISYDNGATWSDFELPFFTQSFSTDGNRILIYNYFDGLLLSDNLGETWQSFANAPANCCFIEKQEIYIEDSLIIAVEEYLDTLFRSWDLGQTWEHIPAPTNSISLYGTFSKGADGFLYCSGDALIYSPDNGATWDYAWWDEVNDFLPLDTGWLVALGRGAYFRPESSSLGYWLNNGLVISTVSDLQTTASGMLFVSASGELFRSADKGDSWTKVALPLCTPFCGFDFQCHQDTVFLLQYKNLFLSIDYGENWQLISDSLNHFGTEKELTYHQGRFFIASSIADVQYSDNWGVSWNPLPMPVPDESWKNFFIRSDTILITDIAGVGPAYRTTDYGLNWQQISGNQGLGQPFIVPWQIFYHDGYLFFNEESGLYRSPDFGDTWTTSASSGLPVEPWSAFDAPYIVRLGAMADTIYASIAGRGVYRSLDEGETWTEYNDGLLTGKTGHFASDDSILYVSTFGAGIWRRNVNIGSEDTPVKELPVSFALSVYPNPASDNLTLTIPNVENLYGRLLLTDIWGRQLMNEKIDANPIALSASLPNGVYQIQLISSKAIYSGKVLILKN